MDTEHALTDTELPHREWSAERREFQFAVAFADTAWPLPTLKPRALPPEKWCGLSVGLS